MAENDLDITAVETVMERARQEAARANYPAALDLLRRALVQAPENGDLRETLHQMTAAALRHESAVERNQAVDAVARDVEQCLTRGDFETAGRALQDAVLKFGRHNTLIRLQERLEQVRKQAELEQTVAYVDQGRAHLDNKRWREAMVEAERVLRRDPSNAGARTIHKQAKAALEKEAAHQDHQNAIQQAADNVERLVTANEFANAGAALRQAMDRFGPHPRFDDLRQRLSNAQAELQKQQRLEWAQRRINEAEGLVKEAGRLSLQGKYDLAIERLKQAQELNPDHPEVAVQLSAAQTAREKAQAERQRAQRVQEIKQRIRNLLDDLQLDEAEALLQTAQRQIGEDPQLQALQTRFERLRDAEQTTGNRPQVRGDAVAEAEEMARQRNLAAAYSWKQIALYPLRGDAFVLLAVLLVAMIGLEMLDNLPAVGAVFAVLRWLLPFAALAAGFEVVRETFAGHNVQPAFKKLFAPPRFFQDFGLVLACVLLASVPLMALLFLRGRHSLFEAASGPLGYLLVALLAWLTIFVLVVAAAPAATFGGRFLARIADHGRALSASQAQLLLAVNSVFFLVAAGAILRIAFAPLIPWIGGPAAAALEAYALVGGPHLVGVLMRRYKVQLGHVYR